MSQDYREIPIPEIVLEHTGRPDGDDAGYRNVAVCEEDLAGQGDPLVGLDPRIAQYSVYAHGAKSGICSAYGNGLGAPGTMLVRQPVNAALHDVNARLRSYDRQVLVLDAYRGIETQRRLWKYLFDQLLNGRHAFDVTVSEFIKLGMAADDIGAYVALIKDDVYHQAIDDLMTSERWPDIVEVATELGKDPSEVAELWLTFHRNNGTKDTLTFDTTSNTAHGGAGAVDAILADLNGHPLNMGVPFDYVGPQSAMTYFEGDDASGSYRLAWSDPILRDYVERFDDEASSVRVMCEEIRANRRLLYHAMMRSGATFYVAESWHWNFGNERNGRQYDRYPHAGSGCHSLLKDVRNPETGEWIAAWGNAWAQRRAAEMLG